MKHTSKLTTEFLMVFSMCLFSSGVLGQPAVGNLEQGIRETTKGLVILTQGLPPLRPKPGHLIGHVVDQKADP